MGALTSAQVAPRWHRWLRFGVYLAAIALIAASLWLWGKPFLASMVSIGCWSDECKGAGRLAGMAIVGTVAVAIGLVLGARHWTR